GGGIGIGWSTLVSSGETWSWDGHEWTRVESLVPRLAWTGTLTYDETLHAIVRFRGDLSRWNGAWTVLPHRPATPECSGAAIGYEPARDRVLIAPDADSSSSELDFGTWTWDERGWRELPLLGKGPFPRMGATLAHHVERGRSLQFGGSDRRLPNS